MPDWPLGGHLAMSGQYASTIGAQRLLYDLLVSRRLGADAKKAERDRIVTWNLGVSLYPSVGGMCNAITRTIVRISQKSCV